MNIITITSILVSLILGQAANNNRQTPHHSFPGGCLDKCRDSSIHTGQIGLTTKYNRCVPWAESSLEFGQNELLRNTTFCIIGGYLKAPRCATKQYSDSIKYWHWDYCKKEECAFLHTGWECSLPMNLTTTSSSISLNATLCYTNNCLLVAYGDSNQCSFTSFCSSRCAQVRSYEDFFSYCQKHPSISGSSPHFNLTSLATNSSYRLYVIPIIDSETIGMVTRLNVTTRPTGPMPVLPLVDLVKVSSTTMRLRWPSPSDLGLPPAIYRFDLHWANGSRPNMTHGTLHHLKPCRKYCFLLRAYYYTETYLTSGITCYHTTAARASDVRDVNVTGHTVSWTYAKVSLCRLVFDGEYSQMEENELQHFYTENNAFEPRDLVLESEYRVKVRACLIDHKNMSLCGNYSEWVKFRSKQRIQDSKNPASRSSVVTPVILVLITLIILILIYLKRIYLYEKIHFASLSRTFLRKEPPASSTIQMPLYSDMEKESIGIRALGISQDEKGYNGPTKEPLTSLSLENFPDHYRKGTEDNYRLIKVEYKNVCGKAIQFRNAQNLSSNEGRMERNVSKNRYSNILPYDHNRVTLKRKPPSEDYINASYISFSGDPSRIEYIASQGPIALTVGDFWKMIWDEEVNCIVMLTECNEDGKFKCVQYWPDSEQASSRFGTDPEFNIVLLEEDLQDQFNIRRLEIYNNAIGEKRIVTHLHMVAWNDFSAPGLNIFERFMLAFHELCSEYAKPPYLVHCSAGVGRTGTFIVIDRVVRKLVANSREVDIFEEVLEVRNQRDMMVQRQAQYIFIYEFVNFFLDKYTQKVAVAEDNQVYSND